MRWTEEDTQKIIDLFMAGHSFLDIARQMDRGRSAVAGRLFRLGYQRSTLVKVLPEPPKKVKVASKPKLQKKVKAAPKPKPQKKPKAVLKPPKKVEAAPIPVCEPVYDPTLKGVEALMALRSDQCRWIEGDPLSGDYFFCPEKRYSPSHPYCAYHMKKACPSFRPVLKENRASPT